MNIALLDINDSNLHLWHGEHLLQSPGYALLEGQQYHFGSKARHTARLRPRDVNNRYWWQLNTKPLQPALGPARHTADLVHAHLMDIHQQGGKPEEIIIAASSSMQREQLSLLLGIIEQCPFNAVGLVNRSVALASLQGGAGKFYHVEIQLHQAVVSELASQQGALELQNVFPLPGYGLLQLQERLVEIIGSAFIQQTRFDPRRSATTEQQLYDHLPAVLLALESSGEYHLEIAGHRVRISRNDLEPVTESLLGSMLGAIGTPAATDCVLLDPLADLLPGFFEKFPCAEHLGKNALFEAVQQHQTLIVHREQVLNFITSLPGPAPLTAPPDTGQTGELPQPEKVVTENIPEQAIAPTHLLESNRAIPLLADGTLVDAGCELYFRGGHWKLRGSSLESVRINGLVCSPDQPLRCGDNISTAQGTHVLLIEVAS